ncbi:hypothetical protein BH11PSE7_BH11PSE7_00320 [soil metagenome]
MRLGHVVVLQLALAIAAVGGSTLAGAQAGSTAPAAKPHRAAASRAAPSPLVTRLSAQKVDTDKDGKETLEPASNVTVGDTIQYSVHHKNISQRRLLQVDFGIPIPPGTSYVEGSAAPEGPRRVRLDAKREQMVWRVEKIEPGDEVTLSLRVRIDPDPTLTPVPQEPRKPQLRRAAP